MKIAILGDTHFGQRSDSIHFQKYLEKFYNNVFFTYLHENKISTVFQLGDLFDRRKFINFNILQMTKLAFFDKMQKLSLHTLIGNHDIYFRSTISVHSAGLVLGEYDNIVIHDKPTTVQFDGVAIDIIPWICSENMQEIQDFIKASKSQICFGHFELAGFEMDRGNVCHDGMDRDILQQYDIVLSGHFHHRSTDGQIHYVGTPSQMTWADYNDIRGFHIFDTETRTLEFIENPYQMFYKIYYDDKDKSLEELKAEIDFSKYSDTYVKIIVENKTNPYFFDSIMEELYKVEPVDISVVEDFSDIDTLEGDDIDQAETTTEILDKYVDSLQLEIDTDKLKGILRNLYTEAQNLESI